MEKSRYSKSKVARLLEGTGIKKSNIPPGSTIPTSFILGYKDLATTPEDYSQMKYTNLEYLCILSWRIDILVL
jgi:hypothetical protein